MVFRTAMSGEVTSSAGAGVGRLSRVSAVAAGGLAVSMVGVCSWWPRVRMHCEVDDEVGRKTIKCYVLKGEGKLY